jgi:hypothetical protein
VHSGIAARSDEFLTAQRMTAELTLSGVLFATDARHCQENFEAVLTGGSALLAQVSRRPC